MKTTELTKIIKEALREVVKEELREVLLEALKSNNRGNIIQESQPQYNTRVTSQTPTSNAAAIREQIEAAMRETAGENDSAFSGGFQPQPTMDVNGSLPRGEVSLDQIKSLIG